MSSESFKFQGKDCASQGKMFPLKKKRLIYLCIAAPGRGMRHLLGQEEGRVARWIPDAGAQLWGRGPFHPSEERGTGAWEGRAKKQLGQSGWPGAGAHSSFHRASIPEELLEMWGLVSPSPTRGRSLDDWPALLVNTGWIGGLCGCSG